MPVSAHSADNRIIDLQLKITATPEGGRLLGIIQPVWTKAIESEQRLHWLKDMIEKKLVVRDIQHFGENMTEQMRAESSREEELERDTLLDLMKVKYSDEKRYHRECVRVREEIKDWLKKKLGRGKYKTILGKVKKREEKRKRELINKYREKTVHLEKEREEQLKEKLEIVPTGLEEYSDCKVFHREEMEKMIPSEIEIKTIGKVKLDESELEVLKLNPKFAIMKKLITTEMEHDTEMCLAKLRYEVRKIEELRTEIEREEAEFSYGSQSKKRRLNDELTPKEREEEVIKDAVERQIYDPIAKIFDYSKRRVTDLPENGRVTLPKEVNPRIENELGMLRELVMSEFHRYKEEIEKEERDKGVEEDRRRNQEGRNLSKKEKKGLKKLKQRIKDGEIIVLKTDKSGKLTVINREEYLKLGRDMIKEDKRIKREELRITEKRINEHTKMWTKIINAGEAHGHNSRIKNSKMIESEIAASRYFMYKDHKSKGGYRPVVSGCCSNTLGLSGILSDMVESLCMAVDDPFEVISSEDLLARISEFNRDITEKIKEDKEYDWRDKYVLLGTDVVSLFPSMSAEKTGEAVRKQAEKTSMRWREIDEMWLSLYVRLNRDLCTNYEEIEHLLPVRRRGRRGREAGMGSLECDK